MYYKKIQVIEQQLLLNLTNSFSFDSGVDTVNKYRDHIFFLHNL